jgi:phosphatidylserine/phosphatidylglycerophosphate/cardiolipin synthase-like enzyme
MIKELDIGAIKISDGFFLARPDWTKSPTTRIFPFTSAAKQAAFLHVHPESSGSNLKTYLLELIRNARKKVFVVSFILTDHDIVQALIEKAAELTGRVCVVTCLDDQRLREGFADDPDDSDSGAVLQMEARQHLTESGVWLRGCSECHAKYALADDVVAVVSTSNFEERPLTQGGEGGICLTDSQEVERLGRHFTRLWFERCDWDLPPGRAHTVARRQSRPSPSKVTQPVQRRTPAAVWTDGNEHHILDNLQRIIDSAEKELLLATWDAVDVAARPDILINPLERARKRGVSIAMLSRRRNPSERSRASMRALANLGIHVLGDKSNHAKGAIADKKVGLLFSANFDLTRGLTSGVEMGVVLDNTDALQDFYHYLSFAMSRASDVFVPSPTHAEMNERLFSNGKIPWPWEKVIIVGAENHCWKEFTAAATASPVLFRLTDPQPNMLLSVGRDDFKLVRNSTDYSLVRAEPNDNRRLSLRLLWNQNGARETKIGFCPAVFRWKRLPD